MYFLWYILIGGVAGWLASILIKGSGSGLFLNIIIGILGGILGGWLLSFLGLIAIGTMGSLLTSFIGAVILLLIVSILGHKKKER